MTDSADPKGLRAPRSICRRGIDGRVPAFCLARLPADPSRKSPDQGSADSRHDDVLNGRIHERRLGAGHAEARAQKRMPETCSDQTGPFRRSHAVTGAPVRMQDGIDVEIVGIRFRMGHVVPPDRHAVFGLLFIAPVRDASWHRIKNRNRRELICHDILNVANESLRGLFDDN